MTTLLISCLLVFCVTINGGRSLEEIANGKLVCESGRVVCNENHVYSEDNTSFSLGQPASGECRRCLWEGDEAKVNEHYKLARPGSPDHAVCVSLIPTSKTRVTINFYSSDGKIIVSHFGIRLIYDSIVINEGREGDIWGHEDKYYPTPYPFTVGTETTVKFVASSNNTLTYLIDDQVFQSRHLQEPLSLTDYVVALLDVTVTRVNVCCK